MGISLLTAPSHAERSSSKASFSMHPSLLRDSGKKEISGGEQMVQAAQEQERSGEKQRARGDGASDEQTAGLTNPGSPLRHTVGVADRLCSASPLLCLSENIQNGNLTPLLKIAEFTRFQLEVPVLNCDNGDQIPRVISKRQHVKPGGGKHSPEQLLSSSHEVPSQEPTPRSGEREAPDSAGPALPPAGQDRPLPARGTPALEPPRRSAPRICAPQPSRPTGQAPRASSRGQSSDHERATYGLRGRSRHVSPLGT